jgi:predicted amidohydrolase
MLVFFKNEMVQEMYRKIHITPNKFSIGNYRRRHIQTFDTDCGKIGIVICYDVPELSRLMADEGMNILFVPFLTDTKRLHSSTLCAS